MITMAIKNQGRMIAIRMNAPMTDVNVCENIRSESDENELHEAKMNLEPVQITYRQACYRRCRYLPPVKPRDKKTCDKPHPLKTYS